MVDHLSFRLHTGGPQGAKPTAQVVADIVFGLVQLAKALRIPRVWGEATVHSAPFYEKLLAVAPIQDLFIIEAAEMEAISSRQDRTSRTGLVTKPATGLH